MLTTWNGGAAHWPESPARAVRRPRGSHFDHGLYAGEVQVLDVERAPDVGGRGAVIIDAVALAPLGETGITPWAGLGLGWEWAKQRRAHGGATASTTSAPATLIVAQRSR